MDTKFYRFLPPGVREPHALRQEKRPHPAKGWRRLRPDCRALLALIQALFQRIEF